ncbi:MAG: prophage LambdaCh01 site-specific recombinase phage integrase [Bacillota bacterium]|nr:MAG: prophage LambdaCh01 site-specific recombinase phage integrase [Bacillota bacterium]
MAGHIRKRKTSTGHSWQVIIEAGFDGNGERKRLYRTVEGTKKDAEKVMNQLLSELHQGTLIEPSKLSVQEYLRGWMKTYVEPNLSPTTIDGYRVNIEKHIIPSIGHIRLQELSPLHLQRFYSEKLKNGRVDGKGGLGAKSVIYIHRNIREALDHALRMQLIPRNVADLVTLPKAKPFKSAVYDEDQIKALVQVAQGTDMELPVTLAAALGLRRGELLGLKWENIDLEKRTINVCNNLVPTSNGNITKAPKSENSRRTLDFPEGLVMILKKHRRMQAEKKLMLGPGYCGEGYVCCQDDGQHWAPSYFSRKFAYFLKRHKLPHIRLHDLRHSNATLMLKYGVPAKVASQRLGHSNIGITLDLYSHVMSDMQKDAADKIDVGLFQQVK